MTQNEWDNLKGSKKMQIVVVSDPTRSQVVVYGASAESIKERMDLGIDINSAEVSDSTGTLSNSGSVTLIFDSTGEMEVLAYALLARAAKYRMRQVSDE